MTKFPLLYRLIVATLSIGWLVASVQGQAKTAESAVMVAHKVGHDCKDNDCNGCASCVSMSVGLPAGAKVIAVHCYTVANYPDDYAHGDLHEVTCGEDVSWSIFDKPSFSYYGLLTVGTTYHNRSSDRDRDAQITVEWQ